MDQEPDTEGVKAVVRGKDGKFLLVKRAEHKDEYPGYWEFPGGGLEDEKPEDGVLRELEEETGIRTEVSGEKGSFTWHSEFTDRRIKSHSFLIEVEKPEVELSREHIRYEWLELDEIFERNTSHKSEKISETQVSKLTEKYRVVTNAIITHRGKILLGKKEEKEGHPISGEWHFPGGHMDAGEEPEEAVVREVKEETGLEVEIHQLVDVTSNTGRKQDDDLPVQVFYHVEAEEKDAEARDDLQETEWIEPSELREKLGDETGRKIEEREEIKKFIERIEKAPY